jgi:hypothetical protein
MNSIKFLIVLNVVILSSCVSDSAYKKLEKEKKDLENQIRNNNQKINDLTQKYDTLNNKLKLEEEDKKEVAKQNPKPNNTSIETINNNYPFITEEQAMQYINDNYSFYDKNKLYRNVQLRRITSNSFDVSLDEKSKAFSHNDFNWLSRVKRLTVYNNHKYDFE